MSSSPTTAATSGKPQHSATEYWISGGSGAGHRALTMKFPRSTSFRLPTKITKNKKFDPERLSFYIVIAFFSIFAVIVIMELMYKDFDAEE